MFHEERNARLRLAIDRDVDGIKTGVFEFKLLNVDDEISRAEMHVIGKDDFDGNGREIGHDRMSIGIDKIQAESMFALIGAKKCDAEGNRALGVNSG